MLDSPQNELVETMPLVGDEQWMRKFLQLLNKVSHVLCVFTCVPKTTLCQGGYVLNSAHIPKGPNPISAPLQIVHGSILVRTSHVSNAPDTRSCGVFGPTSHFLYEHASYWNLDIKGLGV